MKKSKRKLNLKKIAISNLREIKGQGGGGCIFGSLAWTAGGDGGTGHQYTAGCPPTEESACCDTRMDTYCDRET